MKCLSIRQPWAWLIVNGFKPLENRTWYCGYTGPLLIHAGKAWDENYDPKRPEVFQEYIDSLFLREEFVERMGGGRYRFPDLPDPVLMDRGGLVGVARMAGCVRGAHELGYFDLEDCPWFEGPCAFVLRDAEPMEFVPCRGALGLFEVAVDNPWGL